MAPWPKLRSRALSRGSLSHDHDRNCSLPGAVELSEGRFELSVGGFGDWLPGSPELEVNRARGRDALAACLVPLEEAIELGSQRWGGPGSA